MNENTSNADLSADLLRFYTEVLVYAIPNAAQRDSDLADGQRLQFLREWAFSTPTSGEVDEQSFELLLSPLQFLLEVISSLL